MIKINFFSIIFLLTLTGCIRDEKVLMFVGTYTSGESKGIYSFYFDQGSGKLEPAETTSNRENPSFLAISPDKQFLYAVAEVEKSPTIRSGSVISYRILADGKLEKINQKATRGYHPCHVAVSPDGKLVVASNYSSGSLSLHKVDRHGGLDESFQQIQHVGSGPNTARQKQAHAHSALFDARGELLISADLGNDKLEFYKQSDTGDFVPGKQAFVSMKPGAGPRHFAFSPDQQFIYVMNELDVTVTVLKKETDRFVVIETVSALPNGYEEGTYGADIHVSQDGRFVYSSNRGHNSIAVFERNSTNGKIKLLGTESVQGDWPRNFTLSPNGKFLLVANQKSNTITVFKIDKNGSLHYTGIHVDLPSPVCLKFL